MSKHTSGRWRLGEVGTISIPVYADKGNVLSDVAIVRAYGDVEGVANARLIAEAPEMLDVIEQLIDQSQGCMCPNNGGGDCDWCQIVDHARLVIEAIKGGRG